MFKTKGMLISCVKPVSKKMIKLFLMERRSNIIVRGTKEDSRIVFVKTSTVIYIIASTLFERDRTRSEGRLVSGIKPKKIEPEF